MFTQFRFWALYREVPERIRWSLTEKVLRDNDVLTVARGVVAVISLGIFGAIGLISGSGSIFALGLVPVIAFEYALRR